MSTFNSTISAIQRSSKSYGKLSCHSLTKIIRENKDLKRISDNHAKEFDELRRNF
jgi:hypothetical protein